MHTRHRAQNLLSPVIILNNGDKCLGVARKWFLFLNLGERNKTEMKKHRTKGQ